MNKTFPILILIFMAFTNINAQEKFTNIPSNPGYYSDVLNATELNSHYYFLTHKYLNPTTRGQVIYKTTVDGQIVDSLNIISPFVADTVIILTDMYISNDNIELYGIAVKYGIDESFTHPILLKYTINQNMQIIDSFKTALQDTSTFSGINTVTKLDDKIFYAMVIGELPNLSTAFYATDTAGTYLFSNPVISSSNIDNIILHPNQHDYLVYSYNVIGGIPYNFIYQADTLLDTISSYNVTPYSFHHFNSSLSSKNENSFYFSYMKMTQLQSSPDSLCICIMDTFGTPQKNRCLPIDSNFTTGVKFFDRNTVDTKNPDNIYVGSNIDFAGFISVSKFQIANLDSNLNIRWSKTFGNNFPYWIRKYYATSDGGCLITGMRKTPGNIIEPIVFKISNTGVITSITTFSKKLIDQVTIYPNPASNEVHLLSTSVFDKSDCYIYTTTGALVKTYTIHGGDNILNLSGLVAGTYFYKIINRAGENVIGSLIKTD